MIHDRFILYTVHAEIKKKKKKKKEGGGDSEEGSSSLIKINELDGSTETSHEREDSTDSLDSSEVILGSSEILNYKMSQKNYKNPCANTNLLPKTINAVRQNTHPQNDISDSSFIRQNY